MTSIGELDREIRIQERIPVLSGGSSTDEEFVTIFNGRVQAKVVPISGVRVADRRNAGVPTTPTHVFTIRDRSDLSAGLFVLWEGSRYVAQTIAPPKAEVGKFLEITASEIGEA